MKARIKSSGAVIEVMQVVGGFNDIDSGLFYDSEELDYPFFESELKLIDWEQRRWDAAVAAFACIHARYKDSIGDWRNRSDESIAIQALSIADALIEEFKKQKP